MAQKRKIYTIDLIDRSIALSAVKVDSASDGRDATALRLADEINIPALRSRYDVESINPTMQLENHLMRLSQTGELAKTEIVFGCFEDPFHPFEGKFDISMKLLEVFSRYVPGHLTIQTRSPLLVIALPVLKRLGKKVSVTIGCETPLEETVLRYTPGLPRIEERLKLCTALRRFGIETSISVSPVLPYGDWKKDAQSFAKLLCDKADFLHIQPFHDRSERGSRSLRNHGTVVKLADDRKFHWLRADAAKPLIDAVNQINASKLEWPERDYLKPRQLEIFAA